MESRSGGLRARQRLRADPGERGIGRALPTSLGDDGDCAVGGDCREAGRPCIRCLSPASTCRGVFGRSLRAAANCAELCGAVPVSATIAAAPRRGSESAIALRFILTVVRELDVETSAATELACCGFAAGSHITHVQNCTNLHCLQQMTDLHRSLGTPQGWITVQRGWGPPRCCCWRGERCGYPMMMVLTVHYPNIPFYSILFYSTSERPRREYLTR